MSQKGLKQSQEHVAKRIESRRQNNENYMPPGFTPWNKGKTKETDERIKKQADKIIKGKKVHSKGYIEIYMPEHPNSNRGYIFEHIVTAENKIGRFLYAHEQVHHINEIKDDNREENLQVITKAEHAKLHMTGKQHRLGHAPWNKGIKGSQKVRDSAIKAWVTRKNNQKEGYGLQVPQM